MASNAFFHKPELALRRAYELQGIHQDEAALHLLHEVLSGPRRQRTWSPAFEQIIMAYLDLCLKLFRAREAKDGLHQYRNLSQQQAPGSLEKVIRYLVDSAEQKCAAAQAAVDAATLQQTTDTEEELGATPEAILLSTIAMDPAKSQRDSALLLPTLKFLWETYRAILDILRSSSKLEHVYHRTAQGALKFCQEYKRRVEFRHLTEMLRMHLGNLRQYGSLWHETPAEMEGQRQNNKVRGWEGWTTESIELHLQTRFCQLETASILHRYTEGFRTCEDIFNILQISQARRKADPDIPPPKAKLMASYYERLTTLFWVSENYLFHAFAWYKYYSLYKEFNRSMSPESRRLQASAVLLATLCIPSVADGAASGGETKHGISSTAEDDIVKHKMARMATLLGFHTRNPTREALLQEIKTKNLLDQVPDYLRQLYVLLEQNSDPLSMVQQAQPLLEELRKEVGITTDSDQANDDVKDTTLGRYVKPLTQVLLLKLIVNLNKAYHTVSIDFLKNLTSGLGMSFEQVEKAIVVFTQTKTLQVRLDHRAGCLRFGNTQLEADAMRSQLTSLAKNLDSLVGDLQSTSAKAAKLAEQTNKATTAAALAEIRQNLEAEHQAALDRKNAIEKRKELEERAAQEKIRAAARAKEAEDAARRKEEELRIAREQKLREQEKQRRIAQELETQEKKRIMQQMGKNLDEISNEQIAQIDTEALQKEHQAEINKKKQEVEEKTQEAAKKLDYLVRAIRIEELPLVQKKYEERVQQERTKYEQEIVLQAEKAKEQWEADVKDRKAMETYGVFEYIDEFEEKVMKSRKATHREACAEAERKAEHEAEMDKFKRARKRKDDEMKRKAAEEAKEAAEEERRKAEEADRANEEARLEREAKEEERRRAAEEERERADQAARGPSKYVPPSMRGRGGGPGGGRGGGGGSGPSRFGQAYPGGGRYEGGDRRGGGGRDDDRGAGGGPSTNSRWRN